VNESTDYIAAVDLVAGSWCDCGGRLGWARLRPLPTYELAVPTQQRLRRYDEPVSTRVGEQASQGGEERPIDRAQRRSARLPAKHGQLVPQHEQLDVFGELAPPAPNEQAQQGREREIGERKQHRPMLPGPIASRGRPTNRGFETPQGKEKA
jgi:hypothetical protein